jgi:hypothetical protein
MGSTDNFYSRAERGGKEGSGSSRVADRCELRAQRATLACGWRRRVGRRRADMHVTGSGGVHTWGVQYRVGKGTAGKWASPREWDPAANGGEQLPSGARKGLR